MLKTIQYTLSYFGTYTLITYLLNIFLVNMLPPNEGQHSLDMVSPTLPSQRGTQHPLCVPSVCV